MPEELWLVQLLCPQRHCLCAAPYFRPTQSAEEIEAALREEMTRQHFNPWCGICGSRDIQFEHGRLAEQDWDKAYAALRLGEIDQLLTRLQIERVRGETN
jgi:hypothetical protein